MILGTQWFHLVILGGLPATARFARAILYGQEILKFFGYF